VFGESTNIRLIELLYYDPSDSSKPISCKLHVASLKDAPGFTAPSYIRGPSEVTQTIQVDKTPFTVRKNRGEFLTQYRLRGTTDYLWIDALCINQECLRERDH
jgi:hypothetical protein